MPLPNPTEQQQMVLKKYLPETLAQHLTVQRTYALTTELSGDATALRWLIVTKNLSGVLGSSAELVAVALIHHCVQIRGQALLNQLRDTELAALEEGLSFFVPIRTDPDRFMSAAERWRRDAERWRNAPVMLQAIQLASYVEQVKRKNWTTLLQRQQLLERASLLLEALPSPDTLLSTWHKELSGLIKSVQTSSEPQSSALTRVLQSP